MMKVVGLPVGGTKAIFVLADQGWTDVGKCPIVPNLSTTSPRAPYTQFYREKLLAEAGGQIPEPDGVAHVAGITMSFQQTRNSYQATAIAAVADANGQLVSGATVQGEFTGATTDSVSAVTGNDGQATLTSSSKRGGGTWSFCVKNMARSGWAYDAAANLETCAAITAPYGQGLGRFANDAAGVVWLRAA